MNWIKNQFYRSGSKVADFQTEWPKKKLMAEFGRFCKTSTNIGQIWPKCHVYWPNFEFSVKKVILSIKDDKMAEENKNFAACGTFITTEIDFIYDNCSLNKPIIWVNV